MSDWRDNLIDSDAELAAILADTKRIAVLGIKTEAQAGQPAFYVPEYMVEAGYEVVPVPVYYPDVYEILGEPVYRKLAEIPEPVDMVNVFVGREIFRRTCPISSPPNRAWSGCSSASATTRLPKRSPGPGSRSSRTVASWSTTAGSGGNPR